MTRLADIFGQDRAVEAIRRAHSAGRLPHGLIFAGAAGVGKGTTAAGLAGLFLCERPRKDDACGTCRSCAAMEAGAHPDYHVVAKELARMYDKSGMSKATQLSINVIRFELAAPAGRKTVMGQGKVFVVEQAELMTDAAQNALLKTLEEPAGRTLVILLTSHANDLLATVRSRCQTVRFVPLERSVVRRELERRGVDERDAQAAADLSGGSLGGALRFIEDGALGPAVEVAAAIDAVLAGGGGELGELLRKSAEANAEKAMARDELASKDWAVRGGLITYLSIAAGRLRERLMETDQTELLERTCDAIEAVARAEKYLEANVQVALVVEQLGMGLGRREIHGHG